jgi:hypothetical protein
VNLFQFKNTNHFILKNNFDLNFVFTKPKPGPTFGLQNLAEHGPTCKPNPAWPEIFGVG